MFVVKRRRGPWTDASGGRERAVDIVWMSIQMAAKTWSICPMPHAMPSRLLSYTQQRHQQCSLQTLVCSLFNSLKDCHHISGNLIDWQRHTTARWNWNSSSGYSHCCKRSEMCCTSLLLTYVVCSLLRDVFFHNALKMSLCLLKRPRHGPKR